MRFATVQCFFYRIRISNALDRDAALPYSVQDHIERCPACRRFHGAGLTLRAVPPEDTSEEWFERRPVIEKRLLDAVGCREAGSIRGHFPHNRPLRIAALAASLILVLTGGLIFLGRENRGEPSKEEYLSTVQALTHAKEDLLRTCLPHTEDLLSMKPVTEPLLTEVENLAEDAELIKNFMAAMLPVKNMLSHLNEARNGF